MYKARCLNLVTPLSFSINLISYYISESKIICSLNNSTSPAGSYPTIRNWISKQNEQPLKSPESCDILTFFDNNQIISRNWRVNYDHKCKVSAITTLIHIVPGLPSQLQEAPDFSPLKWLYIANEPREIVDKVDELLHSAKLKFHDIRNEFICSRLMKIYSKQCTLKDDLADVSENPSQDDPYEWVTSKHCDQIPKVMMGEPDFVNPCSYQAVEQVLHHIQSNTCGRREWTIVGCDGLPFVLGSRIISKTNHLQNILLLPGLGHYEINMVKCIFKLMWDPVIEDLAKLLGFKSVKALTSCQKCSDHHKAWQIIQILLFGTMDELLLPYVKSCIAANREPSMEGLNEFMVSVKNPKFHFLYKSVLTYLFALSVFRCGVRRNNQDFMLAGRSVVTDLFYGFNCTMYQEIEFKDIMARSLAPQEIKQFMSANESFSVSGHPSKGEGGDFLLESFNRRTKRWLPPGLPTEEHWLKVCRNVDRLEEVSILNVKK